MTIFHCDQFKYTCVSSPVTLGLRVQLLFQILPRVSQLPVLMFQGLDCHVMWCSFCHVAMLLNIQFKGTSGPSLVVLGSNTEFLSQGSWTATAGGTGTELALLFLNNKCNIVFVPKNLRVWILCCLFVLYRVIADENSAWLLDNLIQSLSGNLFSLRLLLRSLKDLPDYIVAHSASSHGNKVM